MTAYSGQRQVSANGLSRSAKRARTIITLAVLLAVGGQMVSWQTGQDLRNGQSAAANSSAVEVAIHYVTVRSGDTLWGLANRYAPQQDPQTWIDEVLTLNNLSSAAVSVGQQLAIPGK